MPKSLTQLTKPDGATRYIFVGGKGGVGKTTVATATAVWFADQGFETSIISTDPTVSLSAVFGQHIDGRALAPVRAVPHLRAMNINPHDASGVFQQRLSGVMGKVTGALGDDLASTPCAEERAAFDQFATLLDEPEGDVIVFDTAPTGKTLRELAVPFDWAGFLQDQITEGKEVARALNMGEEALADLEEDRQRYEGALRVLRDPVSTIFTLVLLPERLPIEETQSAIDGLARLDISVQALVVNQCILPEVIQSNRFLRARAELQAQYLQEIDDRFFELTKQRLPLFDHDVSDVTSLLEVADFLFASQDEAAASVLALADGEGI